MMSRSGKQFLKTGIALSTGFLIGFVASSIPLSFDLNDSERVNEFTMKLWKQGHTSRLGRAGLISVMNF
jgi:hypothetical protein